MEESNSTPLNKVKSLGLRRSIQRISTKTPLSDKKVSNLRELVEGTSLSESAHKAHLTPPRLSLNKYSKDYKGKKLDFLGSHTSKLKEENVQASVNDFRRKYENMTEEELIKTSAEKAILLQNLKQHVQKSAELRELIQQWKGALRQAVNECTRMPGMPENEEQILEMLKIPNELYTM